MLIPEVFDVGWSSIASLFLFYAIFVLGIWFVERQGRKKRHHPDTTSTKLRKFYNRRHR